MIKQEWSNKNDRTKKNNWRSRWSQIDANKNQSETLTAWTNKDDLEYKYKKIFEELVKERFAEKKINQWNKPKRFNILFYRKHW